MRNDDDDEKEEEEEEEKGRECEKCKTRFVLSSGDEREKNKKEKKGKRERVREGVRGTCGR